MSKRRLHTMNTTMLALIIVVFGAAATRVCGAIDDYDDHHRRQFQPHKSSHVTLSLDEFQEIYSSAKLEDAERRLFDKRKALEAEHRQKLAEMNDERASSRSLHDDEARKQRKALFPDNFQVLHHTASGTYNASDPFTSGVDRDVAEFQLDLIVRIIESNWSVVPLIANTTSSMVASDFRVSYRGDGEGDDDFTPVDVVHDPQVMLMLRNDRQVLATNRSGLFRIAFTVRTRVGKTGNLNAVGMSHFLYPLSSFSLRIATTPELATVRDFSVQPSSAVLQVHCPFEVIYCDVNATLPLDANKVHIKWLDASLLDQQENMEEERTATTDGLEGAGERARKGVSESSQVTAVHNVLHTIGDGLVKSSHDVLYETTSEASSLSSVQFLVHGREGIRVTSVTGYALQKWTIEDVVDDSDEDDDDDYSATTTKLVRVTFKSSQLDATMGLQVHTEMEYHDDDGGTGGGRGGGGGTLELPRLECTGVLRQTGHVAVLKEANVEIHEETTRGATRCEPSDVPSKLRLNTDRPIVLSYKYLFPQTSIFLNVKEHAAIDTLEATVDRVHYKAQVMDTHAVHSIILVVQSTKLQYLKLNGLPQSASRYTVTVNSVSTKPVQGDAEEDDNSILIPLLVGLNPEAANEGGSMLTSVELTYFSYHDRLGRNGTLALAPPSLGIPVSVFTTHLRLPERYEYDFTTSDFDRVERIEYPLPKAFSYKTGKRVVPEDYEFSAVDDAWPEDRDESSKKPNVVKIVIPNSGRSFYFQKLLVVDSSLALNATYTEPEVEGIGFLKGLVQKFALG